MFSDVWNIKLLNWAADEDQACPGQSDLMNVQ